MIKFGSGPHHWRISSRGTFLPDMADGAQRPDASQGRAQKAIETIGRN
jgi:hypothetical protein